METSGRLPEVLRNDQRIYQGNLIEYFRIIFREAKNNNNPYHNFRHMIHVTWLCYEALIFYKDKISPRNARNLLIAAMFHDFDHFGRFGNDDLNIEIAIRGLKKHILEEDKEYIEDIITLIKATQFPYIVDSEKLDLRGFIIRDIDLSQCFSSAWIQQVILGLASEWSQKYTDILLGQPCFLGNLNFKTDWARNLFSEKVIAEKIKECNDLIEILGIEKNITSC